MNYDQLGAAKFVATQFEILIAMPSLAFNDVPGQPIVLSL